jgi:serine/threonine protein kinase
MDTVAAPSHEPTCRLCHESIGLDDSHRGYCFGCLLVPALDLEDPDEHDQNGWFDPYEILTHPDGSFVELGRGSMGITYQALDTTLQFPVALKVIDLKAAGLEANRGRFLREARAAARLRHPHVASVLYYGVRKDGQCFYAMELVDGETLAERVRRQGPLSVKEALEAIAQVASALQAAEKFGLVHRDLKPANIMLVNGPGINVKVIDFGLAKVMSDQEPTDRITDNGFVGTPAFASPEQFSGEPIDQRSDYFSLGSTLFYLLTGKPPFAADRRLVLTEKLMGRSRQIAQLKALKVPSPVRQLVSVLLNVAPEGRPRNGTALGEAIATCQGAIAKRKSISAKLIWPVLAAICLVVGITSFVFLNSNLTKGNAGKSIAVLPFDNLSPTKDDSYFADGVQDDILTNLAKIADLRVISRGSVQGYRDPAERPAPKEIGEMLHVQYLLKGSIRREGNRIRVTAQLEEAQTGRALWAERYDGELTDVFGIQAELAEAISQELRAKLSFAEKGSLEDIPTRDLAAYELYLHAKELLVNFNEATEGWEPLGSAARLLNEAVSRDPSFVLAWCLLARAQDYIYSYHADRTNDTRAAAEKALNQAARLRPNLGEVHLAKGLHLLITTRDYPAIRQELETARRTLPNSAYLYGLLASIDSRQGRWRDALSDSQKALSLDPKNLGLIIDEYHLYQFHRQYEALRRISNDIVATGAMAQSINMEKALTAWQATGDTAPFHALLDKPAGPLRDNGRATLLKIYCALADRNFASAEEILTQDPENEFEGGDQRFVCRAWVLGWIKQLEGDKAAAEVAFANARPVQLGYVEKWPDDPNPLIMLALTDAAVGRKEEALAEGQKAMRMRPISQDAVEAPLLASDLAQVYLWAGEQELAIRQLESLENVPRALMYGDLAKSPDWDPLRSDPRFEQLLAQIKEPIPIVNRPGR